MTEVASPTPREEQSSAEGCGITSPEVTFTGIEKMIHLYQCYCAEEGCRVNSTLVRHMQDRSGCCPLERLVLANNYLGPKGLRPVIRLIGEFETLTVINMDRNGADNTTVEALCQVLESHLGVTSLSLRGNPITVFGGRQLLALVEKNPRIIHLDVTETDIFEALQERIAVVVAANRQRALHVAPQLVAAGGAEGASAAAAAAEEEGTTAYSASFSGTALPPLRNRRERPSIDPLPRGSGTHTHAAASATAATRAGVGAASIAATAAGGGGAVGLDDMAASSSVSQSRTHISRPQPRPPAPALGFKQSTKVSEAHLRRLRERFAERAKIASTVATSDASRSAYEVRSELMALERNTRPSQLKQQQQEQTEPQAPAVASTKLPSDDLAVRNSEFYHCVPTTAATMMDAGARANGINVRPPHGVASTAPTGMWSSTGATLPCADDDESLQEEEEEERQEGGDADGEKVHSGVVGADGSGSTAALTVPRATTLEDVLNPEKMSLLSAEEQFQVLFDHGCVEYVHRNPDAAYMAWNEAMRIAVARKNREWMSVVSSNLQRLSYEILADEGMAHLDKGDLEEADRAFELALGVATQSRNAAWGTAMQKARRGVQTALFHRCHEAATLILEKTREHTPPELTEDDCFVVPGTELVVSHTVGFVAEWERALRVQEAVRMWSEASAIAQRVGGSTGEELLEVVADALTSVACFLAQLTFDSEAPTGLSWQGTCDLHYYECIMLSELWGDVQRCTEEKLAEHALLKGIIATHLGHLYLATYQLALAQTQFASVIEYGEQLNDTLLEATGLTFSAIVSWQRANYTLAENQLLEGAWRWEKMRAEPATPGQQGQLVISSTGEVASLDMRQSSVLIEGSSGNGTSATLVGEEGSASGDGERVAAAITKKAAIRGRAQLRRAVPVTYADLMIDTSNHYRVAIAASTFRYSEAVELLEASHICSLRDVLFEKMKANFAVKPTLDQIVAISREIKSPLVYYFMNKRFDWSVGNSEYVVQESVLMWVIPQSPELRFVEINVAKDFGTSVTALLNSVRAGLHLDPIGNEPIAAEIITTVHRKAWIEPLEVLYCIFVYPIIDFIRALDLHFNTRDGVLTIIPSGSLWLVPFNALITSKDSASAGHSVSGSSSCHFLIEDVCLQLAFSATQCAFSDLSAQRVRQRALHRDVVVSQPTDDSASTDGICLLFPFDAVRSVTEAQQIMETLANAKARLAAEEAKAQPTTPVLANSEVLVDDMNVLRGLLPKSRLLHFATSTTSAAASRGSAVGTASRMSGGMLSHGADRRENLDHAASSYGVSHVEVLSEAAGICVVTDHDAVAVLRATEVARMELFAELVVLSNTNMSARHVKGTRDNILQLLRGFFSGGVPCVVAGQWCTPDMQPVDLFARFYTLQYEGRGAAKRAAQGLSNATDRAVSASTGIGMMAGADMEQPKTVESDMLRHRAVCMAHAVRALLDQEDSLRYSPRAWAGYYCFGHSYF